MNRHVAKQLMRRHASCRSFSTAAIISRSVAIPTSTTILDHSSPSYPNQRSDHISNNSNNISNTTKTFQSYRHFSDRRWTKKKKRNIDPFRVLKVRRSTPYKQVKTIFLKVAMQHHPDTMNKSEMSEEEQAKSRDIFIKARQAFEAIVEDPETGGICLREELPDYVADDEHDHMNEWFKQETGHDLPFMDEATMKEVAAMTETMGGGGENKGLDRDGGMWDLARMVTRTVKSGGDGKNLLRLDAGEIKEDNVNNANLHAKRRRKR